MPCTLFGSEYVDLVVPTTSTGDAAVRTVAARSGGSTGSRGSMGTALRSGDEIAADTSTATVRLMDTFTETQQILGAIDPATMVQALDQLAAAIDGKGSTLRRFLERSDTVLAKVASGEPALYADLDLLSRDLGTATNLEPQLAQIVRDSLPVAQTIASKAKQFRGLVAASNQLTDQISDFLETNGAQLGVFLTALAPTYQAFVGGIEAFTQILQRAPQVLANGAHDIKDGAIQMLATFALGRPDSYTAKDCPRYGAVKGSNCP
jgi:ABC-type transporter Mla subunit MlaD